MRAPGGPKHQQCFFRFYIIKVNHISVHISMAEIGGRFANSQAADQFQLTLQFDQLLRIFTKLIQLVMFRNVFHSLVKSD